MPDEIKPPAEAGDGAAEADKQITPEQADAYHKKVLAEAAKSRKERDAAIQELIERKRADDERERLWQEEQGQFKELYEKEKSERAKAEAEAKNAANYQIAFKASLDKRIEAIPEGMRTLVPKGLDPLALNEWLDVNAALLTNRRAPNLDAGAGAGSGNGTPALTPTADDVRQAANFRVPIAEWMKHKAAMEAERANPPQG